MLNIALRTAAKMAARKTAAKVAVSKAARSGLHRGAQRNTAMVRGGSGGGSGMYLFVAHPACCPKCAELGRARKFFSTPDVAYITHPNCLCMTIEAPAGLSPAELNAWANSAEHLGGRMAFGFNYGVPLVSKTITQRNAQKAMGDWQKRMANGGAWEKGSKKGRMKVRATVTPQKKGAVRRRINKEGFEMAKALDLDVKPVKGESFDKFLGRVTGKPTASQQARKKAAVVRRKVDARVKPKAGESFNDFLGRKVK